MQHEGASADSKMLTGGTMRQIGHWVLLVGLAASLAACETLRIVPQYGGVRGTIVGHNGTKLSFAMIGANGPSGGYTMGQVGAALGEEEPEYEGTDVIWRDFGDGKGRVLARVVPANFGVGGTPWFRAAGQPSHYFLREGEFVIEHVLAGQNQVSVMATVPSPDGEADVETQLSLSVVPDQWTTLDITLPPPGAKKKDAP